MIRRLFTGALLVLLFGATIAAAKKDASPPPLPPLVAKYDYKGTTLPVFDGLKSSASGRTAPVYPKDLKSKGVSGSGTAIVVVDTDGKVLEVGISACTHPEFGAATVEAVKKWKYHPIKDASGVPIVHALLITLTFTINGG